MALTCPPIECWKQKQNSKMGTAVGASMFPLTSQVQFKNRCLMCEELQGAWGLRSPGEWMTAAGSGCSTPVSAAGSGANQTWGFKEKNLTTIFSLSLTWCALPLRMMIEVTGKKTISAVKPPYKSTNRRWEFLHLFVGNFQMSTCSSQVDCRL